MIYGKVGRLGHGKTMRMTVDGLALRDQRAKHSEHEVLMAANYLVNVPPGVRFELLPMDGFSEALGELMERCRNERLGLVLLTDEVDEILGATDWQSVSRGDRHRIKQSRKYGVDWYWSAQFVDMVLKELRNITEEVELVQAWPSPSLARRYAGKRPLLIRGQRFRPGSVRELTATPDKDKRLGTRWHLYRREHELLYDTDEILVPDRPEQLCTKHARELREKRCPWCHRGSAAPATGDLAHLVASAVPDELVPLGL